MKRGNNIVVEAGVAWIELRRRSGPSLWASVDPIDLPLLATVKHRWVAQAAVTSPTFYAAARIYPETGEPYKVYMHRLIAGATESSIEVDHDDGNGLNNRRANLVCGSRADNQQNRQRPRKGSKSGIPGIGWNGHNRAWVVRLMRHGKYIRIGQFKELEAAANALADCRIDSIVNSGTVRRLRDGNNRQERLLPSVPRTGTDESRSAT